MAKRKILIIDDENNFCEIIKMNMELFNDYEVIKATHSEEGIALAKKEKPSIILLDLIMPHLNGFEVLDRLRQDKDTQNIPVLLLTARGDEDAKEKAGNLYDKMYINKPIGYHQLKDKIEQILSKDSSD